MRRCTSYASPSHSTATSGSRTLHGWYGSRIESGFAAATTRLRSGCMHRRLRPVPGDRLLEPRAERCARLEAEQLLRARRVERAARLPVRHARVPDDLALEPGQLRDQLGEVADGDLRARAEVHRLVAVVALRAEHEALDRVLDVEELARRRAVAPQHDLLR